MARAERRVPALRALVAAGAAIAALLTGTLLYWAWKPRSAARQFNPDVAVRCETGAAPDIAAPPAAETPGARSILFDRWPRFAFRHPRAVTIAALAVLAGLGFLYGAKGGTYGDAFSIPGAESQELFDLLQERFPSNAGDSASVVIAADAGIDDPAVSQRIDTLVEELSGLPGVVDVAAPEGPRQVSRDGTTAIIEVQYAESALDIERDTIMDLLDWREEASTSDVRVEVGGPLLRRAEMEPPGSAEIIGLSAAVIILLIAFGSLVAMGLPIATALLGLVSSFFLVGVGARYFNMPSFTPQFAAMVGIGVGIDYALLIVTRFREAKGSGATVEEAIVEASGTAGRSVLFAGSTVVIALLGLWAAGISAIGYVGTATSLVVALAVAVALLVLPALLALAGNHVDRWRLPFVHAPAHEEAQGFGYRWSRLVQRWPLVWLALTLTVLVTLTIPALDMRLGSSDAGNNPESFTSRRAYDLLARGFGDGFNGPILLGFSIDGGETAAIESLPAALARSENVAAVSPPEFNADGTAAVITMIPGTAPQEKATRDLVLDLRNDLGTRFAGSGVEPYVGGPTALYIDLGDRIASRIPYFFVGVIGMSFLLLMAVFRSVVVAAKAALMNVLSIGASFGVLVAVFQWGWLGGVVGVHREGPIEPFMPMMLFAVLFGLSMDYEVFLVSRVREEYERTGDNSESVARGLSVTSRVITAAAAIMIAVFLAFAVSDQRAVKEFGIGLAVAIFLDATIVRLILVPSVMQLMGNANWWLPSWLDRLLPRIGVGE